MPLRCLIPRVAPIQSDPVIAGSISQIWSPYLVRIVPLLISDALQRQIFGSTLAQAIACAQSQEYLNQCCLISNGVLFIYSFIYLSIDLFFSIQLTTIYRRRPKYQLKQWLWKLHFYNYSQTAQGPMNLNSSFSQLPRALYATSRCGWSFYNDPRLNLLLIIFTRRPSILHIWGIWTTQLVLGTCCHGYELSWVRVVHNPIFETRIMSLFYLQVSEHKKAPAHQQAQCWQKGYFLLKFLWVSKTFRNIL